MPQTARPQEKLHGVLSRQQLEPPLRDAGISLHYSPDGRYLMAQDLSGIYLFSRDPLVLVGYFTAQEMYPVQFSADSQTITSVGHGLAMTRAKLPSGAKLEETDLPFHDGCLEGAVSPGAGFFACLSPDFKLVVCQLSNGEPVFSESIVRPTVSHGVVFVPLDPDTAFSGPIGFRLASNWAQMVNRGMQFLRMFFSEDGKTLFVTDELNNFRVDLETRRKTSLPGAIHKRRPTSLCVLEDDRVLVLGGGKEEGPAVLSLKSGDEVALPSFEADSARLASNPRYALLSDAGVIGLRVFDLEQNREVPAPGNIAADIFESEMAAVDEHGELSLYRLGEKLPFRSSELPLDVLPVLRSAALTPSFDIMAFSIDGNGAAFSLASGLRLFSTPRFSSANFPDSSSVYLLLPGDRKANHHVVQLDPASGQSAFAWSGGKDQLRSGGTVLLEYALESKTGLRFARVQENDFPYRLRALDPATGKELWKREFLEDGPVTFADPQGERLVLAWNANGVGAAAAARRIPAVGAMFKKAKLTDMDSWFEIVDARSGRSLGGVLVQQGSGPYSFDQVFSAGDALFLVKDDKRISIYSLSSGKLVARLFGGLLSASAQSNLFALYEGSGRLSLYDLATAAKLDQQIFSDSLAYTHFSSDGNRLFVLSTHQLAYVLDVSGLLTARAPAQDNPL